MAGRTFGAGPPRRPYPGELESEPMHEAAAELHRMVCDFQNEALDTADHEPNDANATQAIDEDN